MPKVGERRVDPAAAIRQMRVLRLVAVSVLTLVLAPGAVHAQNNGEVDVRYYQHWAQDGTLVGDMQGYGAAVLLPWRSGWLIGGGIDRLYYDMETPVDVTGIRSADAKPVDAFINVYRVRVDARRIFRAGRRWEPYLEGGLGVFIANSDEPSGVTAAGGVYRLSISTPATPAFNLSAGGNLRLWGPIKINLALSYGRAFRQYRVTDTVSGRSGGIRPLSPLGPSAALVFDF